MAQIWLYPSSQMRKQTHRPARAGALALALSIAGVAGAQTTYEGSNNPAAVLRVERVGPEGTRVTVRQNRRSATYRRLSDDTVLRHAATGMACPLRALDVEVDPATGHETFTLTFGPFLDDLGEFALLDPARPGDALYFTGVRCAGDALALDGER